MKEVFRSVFVSLLLLAGVALALLLSDLHSREGKRNRPSGAQAKIPVAIFKYASHAVLDETERGIVEELASRGYKDGDRIAVQRFNAEGDLPTANSIAKRITDGSFKMVITISTPSLQCVANANKESHTIHVFGTVTDPVGAGVGIQHMESSNKPPWMAGIGTFPPVEHIFREAKRLWPDLKSVGVIWNPAESNSEACTIKARQICRELGIQLLEASLDQSKDVREAADSLVVQGVQAFWTGTDLTVNNAISVLCDSAARAKIPVFSNTSGQVRDGTLFDLGANYLEVGQKIGEIAAGILDGTSPASLVISNFMPERITLNRQVLKKLRDPWKFPDDLVSQASLVIGENGMVEKQMTALASTSSQSSRVSGAPSTPSHPSKIGIAYFGPDEGCENAIAGLLDGLRKLGFVEGRNLVLRKMHANGEIGAIPGMIQSLDASDVDVIVPFSTPVLTAACSMVRHKPVVFTYCSDPVAAGAGKSFQDHLPFVTGIGSFPPVEDAVVFFKLTFPKFKRLGTLYNNAEANSVKVVSVLRQLCKENDIELVEAVANNTSEVVQAAQSLAARHVEAVYIPSDNTAYQAFDGLSGQLAAARIPLVIDAPEFVNRGALAVVGVGYYQSGLAAAEPLARVLRGEEPAKIPIRNVSEKKIILSFDVARKLGISFPPAVLAMQTVDKPHPVSAEQPLAKRWRIQQISYLESVMVEDAMRGFVDGLKEAGLKANSDFTLKTLSAQGDMAALGSLYDSAKTAGVDLYVAYGTPTLQIAIKKVQSTPIVFNVVADPFVAGAGKSDQDHLPNITGVYTQGPYRELAELLRTYFPHIKRVGTLFCPAETNSVANKDVFVREATRCGLTVETVPANSASELSDAAIALCSRNLDAVVQVVDNLSAAGFPAIAQAAMQARLPVFSCQVASIKQGAAVTVARDYYDAGREAAQKVARIMRGESPAQIPFSPPSHQQVLVNLRNARAVGLVIPEELLRNAKAVSDTTK